MRLLILCLLIYLGYRLFKKLVLPEQSPTTLEEQEALMRVDDVMVKDPYCETYFPKRKGIRKVIDGKAYYFCSTACRDKYLEDADHPKESSSNEK
ncbi:MAG: transcriptional regulator [Deltaproteobacteria bacterium]|nr:MAG: transcriptional regulator [Deltaproteobacteria bacterium]